MKKTNKKVETKIEVSPTPMPKAEKLELKTPQRMKVAIPESLMSNQKEDLSQLPSEPSGRLEKFLENSGQNDFTFPTYNMKTFIEECKEWGSSIQVSKWANETGLELIVVNKNGAFQHLSIAKEEAELMIKMINKMMTL